MKNFLLFAGSTYYPNGGAEDFVGAFDSIEAARDALALRRDLHCDWWHIFSLSAGQIVKQYYEVD